MKVGKTVGESEIFAQPTVKTYCIKNQKHFQNNLSGDVPNSMEQFKSNLKK